MSVAFNTGGDFSIPAVANMGGDDNAYLFLTTAPTGRATKAAAAADRVIGISRGGAVSNEEGAAIVVAPNGVATLTSGGAIAANASVVPGAGGKGVAAGATAATDRCIALEAATGADQQILVLLK